MQATPIFLPGESQGQRSLAGYRPKGRKESDTTERPTHTHIHTTLGKESDSVSYAVTHAAIL